MAASKARLDQYRQVFAVRGFPLVMALGLLAKLPVVAIPIILTLHVATGLGRGYGQAGLVIAAWTAGVTVGAPVQGRLIQRYGLRPVLAVVTLAQGVFWGLAPHLSFRVFAVGAAMSGLLLVSGSTVVRLAIGGLVPQARRHTAFAVDSMITELSIMIGPPLAILAVSLTTTDGALTSLAVALALSCGALTVANPRIEGTPTAGGTTPRAAGARRSWLTARMVAVLACSLAAGAIVTGYEVVVVGALRSTDQLDWTGLVLFWCAVCSLAGGLLYGTLPRGLPVPLVIGLLALATMPLGLVGSRWWLLALAIAPAAALVAPAFAATANAVTQEAPGHQAVAMSSYGAVLSAGSSVGAPVAGAAFEAGGAGAGFASVGGLGLLVAIGGWLVLRRRARPPARTVECEVGIPVTVDASVPTRVPGNDPTTGHTP
ncbi:MFS transporter [Micromonospora sp. WMMD882]|uniref:MFS transporter n=1 Tax=Micromonospora sp. WMMD882 TaxID=3015151 RepID=UPI00248B2BFC|nr:MFS transporter [Micromonospora sp. WMMD882]WBB77896.1 MFS transporter [Micromonospora sp. WMMD882]